MVMELNLILPQANHSPLVSYSLEVSVRFSNTFDYHMIYLYKIVEFCQQYQYYTIYAIWLGYGLVWLQNKSGSITEVFIKPSQKNCSLPIHQKLLWANIITSEDDSVISRFYISRGQTNHLAVIQLQVPIDYHAGRPSPSYEEYMGIIQYYSYQFILFWSTLWSR